MGAGLDFDLDPDVDLDLDPDSRLGLGGCLGWSRWCCFDSGRCW